MTQHGSGGQEQPPSVAFAQGLSAMQTVFEGADLAGLLRGVWRRGIVAATAVPVTASEVAERCGLPVPHVHRVLTALVAYEVVDPVEGGRFQVSDRWRPLLLDPAPMSVPALITYAEARTHMVEQAVSTGEDYWESDVRVQAAYATGVSIDPESVHGRELLALGIAMDPELEQLLQSGGRYLELGCGAAGGMCGLLRLYPDVRATGVEISPALVQMARARAERLGITDRMEVILGDAADLDRPEAYDLAFWSQFFFRDSSRQAALRVLHRSLRPGGIVTAPLMPTPGDDLDRLRTDDGREHSVDAVLHGAWGVPERTPEALQQELVDAGFTDTRVLERAIGNVVRAVRP